MPPSSVDYSPLTQYKSSSRTGVPHQIGAEMRQHKHSLAVGVRQSIGKERRVSSGRSRPALRSPRPAHARRRSQPQSRAAQRQSPQATPPRWFLSYVLQDPAFLHLRSGFPGCPTFSTAYARPKRCHGKFMGTRGHLWSIQGIVYVCGLLREAANVPNARSPTHW